ncbi:MAG TPA: hypothetical protein VEK38_00045 [Candidatus Bathyarchaeia archaeon]|nr:hypothetical protein [Candidatus Bathyarchaeia archaeon]
MIKKIFFLYSVIFSLSLVSMEKNVEQEAYSSISSPLPFLYSTQIKFSDWASKIGGVRKVSRKKARLNGLIKNIDKLITEITPENIQNTDVTLMGFDAKNPHPTAYLFVHGHGGKGSNANLYHNFYARNTLGYATFDFPEITKSWSSANLGQDTDICALYCAYKKLLSIAESEKISNPCIVLVGLSRGASAICNFLGFMSMRRPTELLPIKAAVIESPFAHTEDIIKHVTKIFSLTDISRRCSENIADSVESSVENIGKLVIKCTAPSYSPNGIHPIDVIKKILPDIALFFASSKKDHLIPYYSTEYLYDAVKGPKDKERANVDHIILETGWHGGLCEIPEYINAVHKFYEKNELAYNKYFAQ